MDWVNLKKDQMYDILVDYGVASEEALQLAANLCGYTEKTMLDVLYVQTGLRNFEQFAEEYELNDEDYEDEYDGSEDYE